MKYYIGIDNGVNGGISILNNKLEIVEKHIMPVVGKTRKEYFFQYVVKNKKIYTNTQKINIIQTFIYIFIFFFVLRKSKEIII